MQNDLNNFLICSKCGTANNGGAKFCIKCGNPLQEQNDNVVNVQPVNNGNPSIFEQPTNNQVGYEQVGGMANQPSQEVKLNKEAPVATASKFNFFSYILGSILKPYDSYKKEENNLSNIKNVSILALIVIVIVTIFDLIRTIISTVRVTSFWSDEVEWVWDNLGNINYFKIIFQSILIYAIIILAIAGVYFLAGLVLKKNAKFVKLLSVATTAFIPFAAASAILGPILSLLYSPLGACVTLIGFIYAIVILIELVNDLIVIDNKNIRIYYHLICLSILIVGGGYIAYRLILGSLTSGLSSLF